MKTTKKTVKTARKAAVKGTVAKKKATVRKTTKRTSTAKAKTAKGKKKDEDIRQVHIEHVQLSDESRKQIKAWERSERKAKHELRALGGDTVWEIETGNWYGPSKSYDFADLKAEWEKGFHQFFGIPKDVLVEIDYFDTGILSYEKGVYPKYHKRRGW